MRAIVQRSFGGPEVLDLCDVPRPVPAPDEVLVAVEAVALNRLDLLQRNGPAVLPGFTLPHIAGMDVAGSIAELGSAVDPASTPLGAKVVVDPVVICADCPLRATGRENNCQNLRTIGSTRPGGFAEFVAVPVRNVHVVADDADPVELAALPVAFGTAWHGIVGVGRLQAGETLLVHAGTSGVSTAAIQIAKMLGARVIATVGNTTKAAAALTIGADHALINRDPAWVDQVRDLTGGEGVDLAYDHVGPALFQATIDSLKIHGRMVFCGTTTGNETTITLTSVYHYGRTLIGAGAYTEAEFADMVAAYHTGTIRPIVDRIYPFEEIAAAEARLDEPDVVGKVVVRVG